MDSRRLMITLAIAVVLFLAVKTLFPSLLGGNSNKTYSPNVLYKDPATQPFSPRGDKPETVTLGDASAGSKDKLAVTVSNVTAGIDLVQLNVNDYTEYPQSPTHPTPEPLTLLKAQPGLPKPFATIGAHATIGTVTNDFGMYTVQPVWKITNRTPTSVQMEFRLKLDPKAEPNIIITKTFQIDPTSYEISISHSIKNLSTSSVGISLDQMAATDLPRDNPQNDDRFYHAAAFNTDKQEVDPARFNLTHAELQSVDSSKDVGQFNDFSPTKDPFLWISASNRFFATVTRPLPTPTDSFLTLADSAKRRLYKPSHVAFAAVDILSHNNDDASKTITGIRLTGARIDLAPGTSVDLPLTVYFGPKKREILDGNPAAPPTSAAYAYSLYSYQSVIQLSSGGCFLYSFCTFNFLADAILWFLNLLVGFMPWHNFGIAIIVLVIIVRALMHPLTRASQVSMAVLSKKMRTVQPLLEAAKKKYAKDSRKIQEETMRIYRENDVSPTGQLLGCLPMLIQMPIWVALYNGLRTDIDLRHAMFIPGWINDLSNPDALFTFQAFTVPFFGWVITSFNLLPILLGVVFFIQMKVQAASQTMPTTADPSQQSMQKISQYMILIIPVFLYNAPSGLILYMFASTGGGLVDTYFVRKTLRKKGILSSNAPALPLDEDKDNE